eukprot:GILK01006012.1.p1 GENE.GILK01006012.1~~GILK01006012.1.p1  ORF type:complete len:703 (+),score=134.12 GILK01006012.1:38-2146(+)
MDTERKWQVHKFGGTSVANADRYKQVAKILVDDKKKQIQDARKRPTAVVVSAMSKVTDGLVELVQLATKEAKSEKSTYEQRWRDLKQKHFDAIEDLKSVVSGHPKQGLFDKLKSTIEDDFANILHFLKSIWLSRSCSEQLAELIMGHGEVWSAQLLNAYLNCLTDTTSWNIQWLDAREVLTLKDTSDNTQKNSGPIIDWTISSQKLDQWLAAIADTYTGASAEPDILVITGFVCSTHDGLAATLKRNGSDFSASIFGKLLHASVVNIWTDVDGVYSADPRKVHDAVMLSEMTYMEAVELAYFGAKVIHPRTIEPIISSKIPLILRNTFNVSCPGTLIRPPREDEIQGDVPTHIRLNQIIKGFSTVDHLALLNVEGTGMIGVPGVAERLFGAVRAAEISVVLISQASSEHSICFAVPSAQAVRARKTVEEAFYRELREGQIQEVEVLDNVCIVAAVGDNMRHTCGVAAKFCLAMGRANVNIRAIAQGSSERNMSVVIDQADAQRALQAVHREFVTSSLLSSPVINGQTHTVTGHNALSPLLDMHSASSSVLPAPPVPFALRDGEEEAEEGEESRVAIANMAVGKVAESGGCAELAIAVVCSDLSSMSDTLKQKLARLAPSTVKVIVNLSDRSMMVGVLDLHTLNDTNTAFTEESFSRQFTNTFLECSRMIIDCSRRHATADFLWNLCHTHGVSIIDQIAFQGL